MTRYLFALTKKSYKEAIFIRQMFTFAEKSEAFARWRKATDLAVNRSLVGLIEVRLSN